jgi:hypothetical protein
MTETDFFVRNMKVTEENSPSLTSCLTDVPLDGVQPCLSRSGSPTLLVKNQVGRQYFLHSSQDPVEEAVSLLGDRRFHDGDVTVLFGFGLGYLVQEIRKRMDVSHDLIVFEQRPEIFAAAMRLLDLRDILSDPRIRLCIGVDFDTVIQTLKEIQGKALSGTVQKLSYGPAVDLAPEAYRKLENEIELYVSELKTSLRSFRAQIPMRLANLFNNLSVLCQSTPAKALKNAFKGLPAIVVAAGPSLDKNIRTIRNAYQKSPVIAVDAALKPLLASGITPDIIATLDVIDNNADKFSDILPNQLEDIALVFDPEGNWAIPKLFASPRFFTSGQNTFSNWFAGHLGEVTDFPPMYTVSHLAFFVARYMGCDPIILAGFDLSFPGNRDHAEGCAKTWSANFKKWHLSEIEDVHGDKVKTFDQFIYMLRLLEREVDRTQALCIDATEGGARIKGTTILSLKEALNTYVPEKETEIASRLKEIASLSKETDNKDLDQGLRWLDSEVKHAREIIKSAKSIIEKTCQGTGCHGLIQREVLSSLGTMKKQIVERNDFINVLGDLLSDLLIHEIRLTRKTGARLLPETKENQEAIEDYKYFFSKLDKILILLVENSREHLDFYIDRPFEKSGSTEISAHVLM